MDWRSSLQQTLRATESNLARMQRMGTSGRPTVGGDAATAPQGRGEGRERDYVRDDGNRQRNADPMAEEFLPTAAYRPHLESIASLKSMLKSLTSELELERQIREDTVRDLGRRTTHEVAELREMIRGLRSDNIEMKQTIAILERRPPSAPHVPNYESGDQNYGSNAGYMMHSHGSGAGSALLPRVSDLEVIVQRQQRLLEERSIRWEQQLHEQVKSRVDLEVDRMRTIARDAARETTDEYAKMRVETIQQMFSQQLLAAQQLYEKSMVEHQAAELSLRTLQEDINSRMFRVHERLDVALEAREKWMHVSNEIHEMIRSQLDAERSRLDETLRVLRAEVTSASKRQSQEALDVQHSLQHFVAQRVENLSLQSISKDEAQRLVLQAQSMLEQEMSQLKKISLLQKKQFDDTKSEIMAFLSTSETKHSELKSSFDEVVFGRQSDQQAVARVKGELDDMKSKVRHASETADESHAKVIELVGRYEQHRSSLSDVERETKQMFEAVWVGIDSLKKSQADLSVTISKVNTTATRLDQGHAFVREEQDATRQLLESLQSALRELNASWRKQMTVSLEDLKVELLATTSQRLESYATREGVENSRKSMSDAIRQFDQKISEAVKVSSEEVSARCLRAVEDSRTSLVGVVESNQRQTETAIRTVRASIVDEVTTATHVMVAKLSETTRQDISKVSEHLSTVCQMREEKDRSLESSTMERDARFTEIANLVREMQQRQEDFFIKQKALQEQVGLGAAQLVRKKAEEWAASLKSTEESLSERILSVERQLQEASARWRQVSSPQPLAAPPPSNDHVQRAELEVLLMTLRNEVQLSTSKQIDAAAMSGQKRSTESIGSITALCGELRSSLNELDERVTSLTVSRALPPGLDDTIQQKVKVCVQSVLDATLQERLKKVDSSALIAEIKRTIANISEDIEAMDEEIQQLKENAVRDDTSSTSHGVSLPSSRGVRVESVPSDEQAAAQSAQIVEDVLSSDTLLNKIREYVQQAADTVFDELDQQTVHSLEALDEKINMLSATLEKQEAKKASSLAAVLVEAKSALLDGYPELASMECSSIEDFVAIITNKIGEVDSALHTISKNMLDSVDLIQRHEVGFASTNELVQAIVFNSRNITRLAEAIGLEKDAFTLTLNYPELGAIDVVDHHDSDRDDDKSVDGE